jgi:putative endonuclease
MVMNYFLYILQSQSKETFYIGSSDDPERRIEYHNAESKGYTKRYRPWKLVYSNGFKTKEEALRAERKVKSWKSKKMIRLLISGVINIHDYL